MMNRRKLLIALGLLAAPLAAWAQQARKVARIGYLSGATPEADKSWVAAFKQGLGELGYREGENILIEARHAGGRLERLPDLATELVRLKVDVIVAYGAQSSEAARTATRSIPIVMCPHSDPIGTGLVTSLSRPGGNVTGLTDYHAALVPKRMEILKEIVPSASRVAVLSSPANVVAGLHVKNIQAAAPSIGVTVLPFDVKGPEDFERAFAAMVRERAAALVIIADPMLASHTARLGDLAVKSRLPTISTGPVWAQSGLLVSYGTDFDDLFRRAATYVDKILKGTKPGDLPIEQPTKFELVINLKTAKALGLTIPRSILLRADRVIE